jgi:hypothetical protein
MIAYKQTTLSKQNAFDFRLGVEATSWLQNMSFATFFAATFICLVFFAVVLTKLIRKNQGQMVFSDDIAPEAEALIQ